MYAVYSVDWGGKNIHLTKQFGGSKWHCGAWIARIALAGRPTHFYYVVRDTDQARSRLARKVGAE